MGRNGSGKSSLLWALQGSGPRHRGEVAVDGTDPGGGRRRRGPPARRARAADTRRPALPGLRRCRVRTGRRRRRPPDRDLPASCWTASSTTSTVRPTPGTCPRANGCPWRWRSSSPAARRSCCSTNRRGAWTTHAKEGLRGVVAELAASGHPVVVCHPRRRVRRRGRRPGRRARGGRGRRRRTDRRGGRRVAVLRSAGREGAGTRSSGSPSARSRSHSTRSRRDRHHPTRRGGHGNATIGGPHRSADRRCPRAGQFGRPRDVPVATPDRAARGRRTRGSTRRSCSSSSCP